MAWTDAARKAAALKRQAKATRGLKKVSTRFDKVMINRAFGGTVSGFSLTNPKVSPKLRAKAGKARVALSAAYKRVTAAKSHYSKKW